MTPLWAAVLRLLLAGGILTLWAARRTSRPTRRDWSFIVAIGVATNVVYLGLLYVALRHLSAGMAAIIASTNPLMLALVAPLLLRERLRRRQVVGLILGFAGVVLIMSLRAGSPTEQFGDELIGILSVSGLVASTILFKRAAFTAALPIVTGLQLLIGALVLVPIAALSEGAPHAHFHASSLAALVYLVLVMSIGASLLWFWLLEHGEASRLSAYYYVTPVLGLVLSWILIREPLHATDLAGAAVVALGIALVAQPRTANGRAN